MNLTRGVRQRPDSVVHEAVCKGAMGKQINCRRPGHLPVVWNHIILQSQETELYVSWGRVQAGRAA
jgi:hypothetical protein